MNYDSIEAYIRKVLGQLKDDEVHTNAPDPIAQRAKELDSLGHTTLDIAITGGAGAGKSSFVNALLQIKDYDEGAAEVGVTETTMKLKSYPHHIFPKVTIWDLPGIGTPRFKAREYLEKVGYKRYDFFIIVASCRFTENDVLLTRELMKMEKKFYYVRTQIDKSIEAEKRKAHFNEEKCLQSIRNYCCYNLREVGESKPMVFLISNWHLDIYDFPLLLDTLEKNLDDLKRHALIMILPAFSKEVLKKKKAAMESLIWKVALVSCGIGAVPKLVPFISLVCDFTILVVTMKNICKSLGLDEDSLCKLAKKVDKPVYELRSAIKKTPMVGEISISSVYALFCKATLHKKVMPSKFILEFKPVFRCLAGGALSFLNTLYFLKTFLDDAEEDAENVWNKAMEAQPK